MIGIGKMSAAVYSNIITDTTILINYHITEVAIIADTYFWNSFFMVISDLLERFIKIISHDITTVHNTALSYPAAYADNRIGDLLCVQYRSFCNKRFFQNGIADLRRWQHACSAVYHFFVVKQVECG